MVAASIIMTNPNVNGGNPVTIFSGDFSLSWNNLTKSDPVEGKYDIVESHYGGFENPKIVVKGQFDADNKDSLSNYMTYNMLVNFAIVKSGTTTLKVSLGSTPLVIGGRPNGGYSTSGANTLDTTNGFDVQIDSFNIGSTVVTKHGRMINFIINMHETA